MNNPVYPSVTSLHYGCQNFKNPVVSDIMECPRFLTQEEFNSITEVGWEFDEENNSFHFLILVEKFAGINFDVFVDCEEPLRMTLYFEEFELDKKTGEKRVQLKARPQGIEFKSMVRSVRPYLDLGYEWRNEVSDKPPRNLLKQ